MQLSSMTGGESVRHRGTCLFVSVLVSVLVLSLELTIVTSATPLNNGYIDNRGKCYVNGGDYSHGQVFTIPGLSHCLKYRCNNGGWGIYEEGCEHRGACHPVGSTFDDACTTYTCTKSSQDGYSYYQPIRTRTRCQDYYGACRQSGSRFPYAIRGRLYQQCSCTARSDGFVSYTCYGK